MAIQSTTDRSYRTYLDEIYKFKKTQKLLPAPKPDILEAPDLDIETVKRENLEQFRKDFTDFGSFDELIDQNVLELEKKYDQKVTNDFIDDLVELE